MPKIKKPDNKKTESTPLFSRGFDPVRRKVEKGSRFTMSCYNCDYYYQAVGDTEEVCQNPEVLKYDMVITNSSIYCNRWRLTSRQQSVKKLFEKKKGGK